MRFRRRLLEFVALQMLVPALALAWCVGGAPPARDPDDDGLNDIQEEFFATDPHDADTDDDGISDANEDHDGDGVLNKDEPTLFSLEFYADPFAHFRRYALILEGTNLFDPSRSVDRGSVHFPLVDRSVAARLRTRRNFQTRVYLRLSSARARRFLNDGLDGIVRITNSVGVTNVLYPVDMHCQAGPPSLMGAAVVRFKITSGIRRSYLVIGGCPLLDRQAFFAATTIHHGSDAIVLRAPGESVAMLPDRVILPIESLAGADPVFPPPAPFLVGDTVQVETVAGMSNGVVVEDIIADLRIPVGNLDDDHDRDDVPSQRELTRDPPTDPLVWDTDGDGLSDGVESRPGSPTDPLDPDTDGDGILDGAE